MGEFPNKETQFKPGQSGNPGGYSKKRRFSAELERLLEEEGPKAFFAAGWLAAKAGDFNFWKYIWERHEGPMAEPEPETDDTVMEQLERRAAERTSQKPASGFTPPVPE